MKKIHIPVQWVAVAMAFLLACIVGVQIEVLQNEHGFNTCLKNTSVALAQHTNDTNNAITKFINQSTKLSLELTRLQSSGAKPNDPRIQALRIQYAAEISGFKSELHDTQPPGCNV